MWSPGAASIRRETPVQPTTSRSTTYATAPVPTLVTVADHPTNVSPIRSVILSEPVTGFDLADISLSNGTAGNITGTRRLCVGWGGCGVNAFAFDITPSADARVIVNLAAGVTTDAAGNSNTAASPARLIYDGTAPDSVAPPGFVELDEQPDQCLAAA